MSRSPKDKFLHLLDQLAAPAGLFAVGAILNIAGLTVLGNVAVVLAVILLVYNLTEWSGR